jgi:hypothetical protein
MKNGVFWDVTNICVALVRTDVSEEPSASFIRVTRIGELGTTLALQRVLSSFLSSQDWRVVQGNTPAFCSTSNRFDYPR